MTKLTLLATASALMIAATALAPALAQAAPVSAAVESSRAAAKLKYAGALTFSPDGVLFVGDNISGAVFAYPTSGGAAPTKAAALDIEGIDGRIAALLKTPKSSVHINGMAVHPISHDVYLSVSFGGGIPALVKVSTAGVLSQVDLARAKPTNWVVPNAPTPDEHFRDRTGDARPGTTTMAVAENNVVGFVQAPDGPYRIWPIGGGLSAVIKVDPTKLPPEHPPEFKEKMGGGSNRGDARPGAAMHCPPVKTKPTTISVLVAYTPAVLSKVPLGLTGITGLVNTAIAEANQSYQNSGIDINLVAAPAVPVAIKYQETGVMAADVDAFSKMADVAKARATNHSNVAVLLVAGGKYCGWSQEIMATRATAFSVVYWDCAIGPQYSFGHEIGHLQGARHNPEEDSASFPFPYGHGFLDLANKRRTMMAYDCPAQNCSRQPEWARPTLWGNVTVSNDARVLNETATCISNF